MIDPYTLDIVARAFGFRSAAHLESVLDGTAPSALAEGNPKWQTGRGVAAKRLRAAAAQEQVTS